MEELKVNRNLFPAGYGIPENFDPKFRPRRQDWAGELHETGMFYLAKRAVIENGVLQNNRSVKQEKKICYRRLA